MSHPNTPPIRLRLFGPPAVLEGDRLLAGAAAQPRRLALLALLADAGDRGMTRDKLLLYLWPDATEERARKSLTQAVYALRRELGHDDALVGARDLRLNPEVVGSDLADFRRAIAAGRFEEALSCCAGPFLDGFHVSQLPEFEEWASVERLSLARDYAHALEEVAGAATARGDHPAAVRAWRERSRRDPHDARVVLALMSALAQAGDRNGALECAREYERAVRRDLGLSPDPAVAGAAEQLRRQPAPRGAAPGDLTPRPDFPAGAPPAPEAAPARGGPGLRRLLTAGLAVVVVAVAWWGLSRRTAPVAVPPHLAVGQIADFTADSLSSAPALADLLATNLARTPALRVVSTARMYELLHQAAGRLDGVDPGTVLAAARQAGAAQLLDGSLHRVGPGRLRLDLRLLDLADGSVVQAYTVEGGDLFSLADSGTRLVYSRFLLPAPGSVVEVTARSEAALRLYDEGLRALVEGERSSAERLFLAALEQDSSFAMAAYYAALTTQAPGLEETVRRWERAVALADRAPERERLLIKARSFGTPPLVARALADSFVSRYPDDVDGQLLAGQVLQANGEFALAAGHLRRAIAMDSASLRAPRGRCIACEAYGFLVAVLWSADSTSAALDAARAWFRQRPGSSEAALAVVRQLMTAGRFDAAERLAESSRTVVPAGALDDVLRTGRLLAGDFEPLERDLEAKVSAGHPTGVFQLTQLRRAQGRFAEALALARQYRALAKLPLPGGGMVPAQILFESGRLGAAAALLDSMIHAVTLQPQPVSAMRWRRSELVAQLAEVVAAQGDTVRLVRLADSIEVDGAFGYALHRRLHWHARGLLAEARGEDAAAIRAFREALHSPTRGHAPTSVALARVLLRQARPREAIAVASAALRGQGFIQVTPTELHAQLAEAWSAAGQTDSALAHRRWVERAWSRADRVPASRPAPGLALARPP